MSITTRLLAATLATASTCAISNAEDLVYTDNSRSFRVSIPRSWKLEKFATGPLALRIESNTNNSHANCSITSIDSPPIQSTQEWIDKNINETPIESAAVSNFIDNLKTSTGDHVIDFHGSQTTIGKTKSKAIFYSTISYSDRLNSNLYANGFYTYHIRRQRQIGVTCLGGGLSSAAARTSFESNKRIFKNILESIEFENH